MSGYFDILNDDSGSLFVQPDGPNSTVHWLGCHTLENDTKPNGDVSMTFQQDPAGRGRYVPRMRAQGQGGVGSFDISFPIGKTADWLEIIERRRCPVAVYVEQDPCGERNIFGGAARGTVWEDVFVTSKTRTNYASRLPDGAAPSEAMRTFSFSYTVDEDYFSLVASRWTVGSVEPMTAIAPAGRERCLGACGAPQQECEVLLAVEAAAVAAAAVIWHSEDFGHTWTASAADPFAVAENVRTVVAFPLSRTVMRWMVARGTTDAGNPAEIAYSDDSGATWTAVNVGATNAEWINDLFAWTSEGIWAATDTGAGAAGNVYFSEDGGLTWDIVLTGASDSLNDLHFATRYIGLAVGDTNEVQYTEDGGEHWTTITGPAAQAAADVLTAICLDEQRWFLGYDDGELWFTQDGGTTWTQRTIPRPAGATAITAVSCSANMDDFNLWLGITATVGGNPFSAIMRSVNGGMNWESWLAPVTDTTGCVDIIACSFNRAFGVGGKDAGPTGMLFEVAEQAG